MISHWTIFVKHLLMEEKIGVHFLMGFTTLQYYSKSVRRELLQHSTSSSSWVLAGSRYKQRYIKLEVRMSSEPFYL